MPGWHGGLARNASKTACSYDTAAGASRPASYPLAHLEAVGHGRQRQPPGALAGARVPQADRLVGRARGQGPAAAQLHAEHVPLVPRQPQALVAPAAAQGRGGGGCCCTQLAGIKGEHAAGTFRHAQMIDINMWPGHGASLPTSHTHPLIHPCSTAN